MADQSRIALGAVVAELREARGLTQAQLADAAEYGKGGAVSISRFENGAQQPRPAKLAVIADVLGATVAELEERAAQWAPTGIASSGDVDRRVALVRDEVARRERLTDSLEQLGEARSRAERDFLGPLAAAAARIKGAPDGESKLEQVLEASGEDESEARYQLLLTRIGMARALANGPGVASPKAPGEAGSDYAAIAAEVAIGAAPLVRSLPAGTAFTAYRALMGARPISGPGVLMAVGAGVLLGSAVAERQHSARVARRRAELESELAQAEKRYADEAASIAALEGWVDESAKLLDYVAVHAAHALKRWQGSLPNGEVTWKELTPEQRGLYEDFVEIAAALLTVVRVALDDLMEFKGEQLAAAAAVADEVLVGARETITSRV